MSLRSEYEREVARGLQRRTPQPKVTEQDLGPLPPQLQRYLVRVGAVGQPRVQSFRVQMSGRIRGGPGAPWMPLEAEQHSFVDEPTRLFFLRATMKGLPVVGLHAYVRGAATMRIKLLGLIPVVNQAGSGFTRAETVTLFNDLCVLAPSALIDPAIRWEVLDPLRLRGTFSVGAHTISAVLVFDSGGELRNFTSDDRPSLDRDGVHLSAQRWSTPLGPYRDFGPFHLTSSAETRYAPPSGEYVYGEFEITSLAYNVGPSPS